MTRRGSGEGNIYWRGDRCYGRISIPHPGPRRVRKLVTGKSRKEVLAGMKAAQKYARAVGNSRITLAEWLEHWQASHLAGLRSNTVATYRSIIKNHLLPRFGQICINDLSNDHLEPAFRAMRENLAPRSMVLLHTVFSKALKQAVASGKAMRNLLTSIPRDRVSAADHSILGKAQLKPFHRAARGSRFYLAYLLMLGCGLRCGETLALRWSDISLERRELTVNGTLVKTVHGMEINPPKTKMSRRTLALPASACHELGRVPPSAREGHLFFNRAGGMVSPDRLRRDFLKVLAAAGIDHLTLHELRHTHASLLLHEGVDLPGVGRRLGHSTIKTTADIYGHEVPGAEDRTRRIIDRALGPR